MNEWTLTNDSLCVKPATGQTIIPEDNGMQGEKMPYKLVSDSNVMAALMLGFLLIVIAMQNEKKGVIRIFRKCISTSSDRANLFDDNYNSTSNITTVLLCCVSGVMGGLLIYHYYSYSNPDFFFSANHPAMMGIYAGALIIFLILKWIMYSFINWIFFDKEKNRQWIENVFNIIAALGFTLFPTALYIVFLDSEFHFSAKIILIIISISKILLFYKCFRYFFRGFHGVLHLILYFCTLEIIPDLFLWKGIELINSILILKT
ncbi:DUF4271 domain-containing protein [uncultured Bacteroides sp.]|uniref:DUF4271 domain-containing protein n=1 Tax=uncultured Bacteroides sp. TaxID=162156 RepID=UPI0026285D45|nr:DUF4271 domain-containing protein [uncultured Bacteroides sp.]